MQGLLRGGLGTLALLCALGAQALSVGGGGQASYGLPIAVPPGVSGMSPNLALSYADGGINGPVGVGWSVQGISTVTRCPSSKLIDGALVGGIKTLTGNSRTLVRFDGYDRLCLDGQRLIAVDATTGTALTSSDDDAMGLSGSSVREFRTEKDSFSRIRAYGMAVPGNPHAGPAYLKVWTKSGQIYEYGLDEAGVTQSRINAQGTSNVAVWAVSRISDTLSNFIEFRYEQRTSAWGSGTTTAGANGLEWNLLEVHYTGNSVTGASPANKVVFDYEDRADNANSTPADRSEAYQGASKNVSIRRLKGVRTLAANVPVRSWVLSYETSPRTGRSRLVSVKECVDAANSKCLPATVMSYSNGASPSFVAQAGFANSELSTKPLIETNGWRGNLTGDFNGDGKTDIIRWSNNPAENELYFSAGDGSFVRQWGFNLVGGTQSLFTQNGCYTATVMDFNGDGRSDILRISKPSCSTGVPSAVYLSNGDGTFTTQAVSSAVDFTELTSTEQTTSSACMIINATTPGTESAMSASSSTAAPSSASLKNSTASKSATAGSTPMAGVSGNCIQTTYSGGRRFYLMDVNADGLPDIVTTYFPYTMWNSGWGSMPPLSQRCSDPSVFSASDNPICTRVFINNGSGVFEERLNHPNAYNVLYNPAPTNQRGVNPYWRSPTEGDVDGDGLVDVVGRFSGLWRNKGDGSFESSSFPNAGALCVLMIDFNGDQRGDCLRPSATATQQTLTANAGGSSGAIARFNLNTAGHELYGVDSNQIQNLGVLVEDIDGDGRQDILRWSTNTALNGIYLSNGDGSFRGDGPLYPRLAAGLSTLPEPLMANDGTRSFITGDFLGTGSLQILQLRSDAAPGGVSYQGGIAYAAKANVLRVLEGDRAPVDHLMSVTTGTGVRISVDKREPLTTSARYFSDRGTGNAAVAPQLDVQMPSYIITSTTKSSPGYGDVTTEYSYHGLKAERDGRGMLGYRETRQQVKAPNGQNMTIATRNLLAHPYIGVAGVTETYLGPLSLSGAQLLSRTTYSYCDKTSGTAATAIAAGGTAPAPCATTAKIQKPYLYQSLEEGWDLNNANLALPQVRTTNTYNDSGDPTKIEVTTTGMALGMSQTFTKTVDNTYKPNNTSGDSWILGRLETAKVTQTAPNSLPSIGTSAGGSAKATQRDGNGATPTPPPLNPAVLSAILSILLDD